jgi:hypothetical protein
MKLMRAPASVRPTAGAPEPALSLSKGLAFETGETKNSMPPSGVSLPHSTCRMPTANGSPTIVDRERFCSDFTRLSR